MGGYDPLKQHPFFDTISWSDLHLQTPPKLTPYLPAMSEDDEDCYGNVCSSPLLCCLNWVTVLTLLPFPSMTTSLASSATCRWPSLAPHTPFRRTSPRPRRDPAATSNSTSTTWTTTLLSWTCSSLRKRSSCCWISRPVETPGNPTFPANHSSSAHGQSITSVSNVSLLTLIGTSLWRTT